MARRLRLALLVAVPLLALDVATKRLAEEHLAPGRPVEVLGSALRLRLAYNRGAAMSLPIGEGRRWLLVALSSAVLAGVLVVLVRTPDDRTAAIVALALISAGAVGNLIDRVASDRGVVDFIDAGTSGWRFWTFNVADSCVTAGVLLLILFGGEGRKKVPAPQA